MTDTLTKELYEETTNLLHDMGTPAHIKGHYYLRTAILEVYFHPELLKNMMNGLYALIADTYDTTSSCVERSIRNAVEATLDRGDVDFLYSVFRNTISKNKGKPTNREFIMMVVDVLRVRHM
ncbi:sporulation initiation factor Spo0A C-terminal domain-containing protein [[Clostridium] innocuum]|nr:sporulation initiation factor Spo0A C-terminal domain-containing protein [[Clostridium] innocuum]